MTQINLCELYCQILKNCLQNGRILKTQMVTNYFNDWTFQKSNFEISCSLPYFLMKFLWSLVAAFFFFFAFLAALFLGLWGDSSKNTSLDGQSFNVLPSDFLSLNDQGQSKREFGDRFAKPMWVRSLISTKKIATDVCRKYNVMFQLNLYIISKSQ